MESVELACAEKVQKGKVKGGKKKVKREKKKVSVYVAEWVGRSMSFGRYSILKILVCENLISSAIAH